MSGRRTLLVQLGSVAHRWMRATAHNSGRTKVPVCMKLSPYDLGIVSARLFNTSTGKESEETTTAPPPPHWVLEMPNITDTRTVATVTKWYKMEGEECVEGEALCEIETDELVMDVDSKGVGYLARIIVPEGAQKVPGGEPLAIVVTGKEHIKAFDQIPRFGAEPEPEQENNIGAIILRVLRELQESGKLRDAEAAKKLSSLAIENHKLLLTIYEGSLVTDDEEGTKRLDQVYFLEKSLELLDKKKSEHEPPKGVDVLRLIKTLHKEGKFGDEDKYKTLCRLARKNDDGLLMTYEGSFEGQEFDASTFDEDFFVQNCLEIAEEALEEEAHKEDKEGSK